MEMTAPRRSNFGNRSASLGRAVQVKQLIEGGASVNMVTLSPSLYFFIPSSLPPLPQVDVRTIHGSTPLCNACAAGSLECAKMLLEHGAKVSPSLTALTASPLHEACIKDMCEYFRSNETVSYPLHAACAKEHVDCARVLLKAGAKVNAAKFHETALHHAARVEMVDMIELLVDFGGNMYVTDNNNKKPIDYTKPGSPTEQCLQYYESNLQQLSRVILRTLLGTRALEVVGQLDISQHTISYVLCEGCLCCTMN
uniref:Ankyrin repeat and SOCS box containing 13a, tandem duplicate 1 n=1 Tax=Hucho hucho TaxID=62062 RepID=A0A4W5RED0_9TELE